MGRSACDYNGYGKTFLIKSDLKPSVLRKYGINASVARIKYNYAKAADGYVITGGTDWRGVSQKRRTTTYSIRKLKDILG